MFAQNIDCGCASMSRSKRIHTIYVLQHNKKIIFETFNSADDLTDKLFVATIQICNDLVFLCLQNQFVSVSIICEATRFAITNLSSILNKMALGSLVAHLI